jgi:RecA/RadA recombinase
MAKKLKTSKIPKKTKKKSVEWDLDEIIEGFSEAVEKKYGETPLSLNEDIVDTRISTSSLCIDLMIGGGIPTGRWIVLYGRESSGKSTVAYQMLKGCLNAGVKKRDFFDYESSLATEFFAGIMEKPLDELLGKKDENDNWIKKPKIRHYMPEFGEKMFRITSGKMKMMPDVITVKNKRYLKFNPKLVKALKVPAGKISFTKDNYAYIEDSGSPIKYAIFVDSFPEMLPEALYDDEEKSPMAQQARMFSSNIPLIRPRLRSKGAILIGINHTRLKPAQMFGNPEYQPCGEHIKLATDIRIRVSTVAIPHGKGYIEEEFNLDGKLERFAYTKLKTYKNKTFPKDKETTLRICIEKAGQSGYGIDLVWDTFQYLRATDQIKKRGDTIVISFPGPWEGIKLNWSDLKKLITRPEDIEFLRKILKPDLPKKYEPSKEYLKGIKALKKAISKKSQTAKVKAIRKVLDIRSACFHQIQTRKAFSLTTKDFE